MKETFPCFECQGGCCGPVAINKQEFERLKKAVSAMKPSERKRLQEQERPENKCIFYDMERRKCGVYAYRPELCRMFGHYEMLECPKVDEDNYPVKLGSVKEGMAKVRQFEEGATGILSLNTFWRDFL